MPRKPFSFLHCCRSLAFLPAAALLCLWTAAGHAADFQATGKMPTTLYDGPSLKARPLFLYGEGVPVEIISTIEGWSKVRDAQGAIGWIERSQLLDKRVLQVRGSAAPVRAQPRNDAPLVFTAEENVLLTLDETATSPTTTATPGWVRVRHADGQAGYTRVVNVFGL